MYSYCAFLGHQPSISLAELYAVIPDMQVDFMIEKPSIVIFGSTYELNQATVDALGGTIILGKNALKNQTSLRDVPKILCNEAESIESNKITFSIRSVGLSKKEILNSYRDCKESLRKKGLSSRYIGNDEKPAMALLLHKEGLITKKKGVEMLVIRGKQEEDVFLWIGTTIGAQDINAYTKRDIKKPVRDTEVGLLPPKLAQIMLNFGAFAHAAHTNAFVASEKTKYALPNTSVRIFDPFCGTGVIPMEALLRGYSVRASDMSPKAVSDTQKNVAWLRSEYEIPKEAEFNSTEHRIEKPFAPAPAIDVVVTETTLGPNLHKRADFSEASRYAKEAEVLEAAFISNVAAVFPKAPIVCMFPVWYTSKGEIKLKQIWSLIEKKGYTPVLPSENSNTTSKSLIYRRPEQFVGREIVILLPKK